MFGVFEHKSLDVTHPLMRGLDDVYYVPHSRHTETRLQDIALVKQLQVISYSEISGVHIISDMDCRQFFVTGHSEYDRDTLAKEYFRDKEKGLDIDVPFNYFPNDDDRAVPIMSWKSTANIIFSNWLNYFVYQKKHHMTWHNYNIFSIVITPDTIKCRGLSVLFSFYTLNL